MKVKALIASDDMEVHQLMHDLLGICYRNISIERALSLKSFWTKVSAPAADAENGYHIILLSLEYINEEPEDFVGCLKEVNPGALSRVIIMGEEAGGAGVEGVEPFPFLAKPFSMERFEEVVKAVCG